MQSPRDTTVNPDLAYHFETYRNFVRYSAIFVVHVAAILALMAYFLA